MAVCLLILYICSVAIFFPWSLVIFHILLLLFFMLVVSLHGFCATSFWTISHLWMGWVPTEQLFLRDVGYSGARIRFCINSSSSNRVGNLTRQGHLTKLFKLFLLPRKQWSTIARSSQHCGTGGRYAFGQSTRSAPGAQRRECWICPLCNMAPVGSHFLLT